jgi:hypothetical protein
VEIPLALKCFKYREIGKKCFAGRGGMEVQVFFWTKLEDRYLKRRKGKTCF